MTCNDVSGPDNELKAWADRIALALAAGSDVFCYFKHELEAASTKHVRDGRARYRNGDRPGAASRNSVGQGRPLPPGYRRSVVSAGRCCAGAIACSVSWVYPAGSSVESALTAP